MKRNSKKFQISNFKFQIDTNSHCKLGIGNWVLGISTFQKGFTLVELLIVIAIIGILSTLLMTNFIGVRQRARDAQRKADVRQIQSALELYRADNGSYPAAAGSNGLSTTCPTPQPFTNNNTTYMAQ